jgi:hypothetical protein
VQAAWLEKLEIKLAVAHGSMVTGHGGSNADSGHGEM